jgi:hypothetical protein
MYRRSWPGRRERGVLHSTRATEDTARDDETSASSSDSIVGDKQGSWRKPAEMAPDPTPTLRTCGVMPAEGAQCKVNCKPIAKLRK